MNNSLRNVICLILILLSTSAAAQRCETFNRELFNWLTENVPDKINCIDAKGQKQGWWIYYNVDYNPIRLPDELDSGYYVKDYIYGQYEDNKKIGRWTEVANVHLITERRVDSYYYAKDTVRVRVYNFWHESAIIDYIKDSSIVNYISIEPNLDERRQWDTLQVTCDMRIKDKEQACKMIYQNREKKRFPYSYYLQKIQLELLHPED